MNQVRLECDDCWDEGRAEKDCFTLTVEHLLDGSRVWYCAFGHLKHLPTKNWKGKHKHSGYGLHPISRAHKRTEDVGRRFLNIEEFQHWHSSERSGVS